MNRKKKMLLLLLVICIAIQFVQPPHNISGQVLPTDITNTVSIPDTVLGILKTACYDCHSNHTRYPWYGYIQPFGWLMAGHIKTGRENLNFSEFGVYSKRKQANKLRSMAESIKDGSMPLPSYINLHVAARLSAEDKKLITQWASHTRDSLANK